MSSDPIVIASYARTPIGGFQGTLSSVKATDLGATAVKAAVQRAGFAEVGAPTIDRIYMGCVVSAGLGQAPARQAAIGAGLSHGVQATTVNKMCGSGMQATIMAYEAIASGAADVVIAGGMESMSNAPYLLAKHRSGARMGHDSIKDAMFLDGLEDAYEPGVLMGVHAEAAARRFEFARKEQDAYAVESVRRAQAAISSGAFDEEVTPVEVTTRSGNAVVTVDEQPGNARIDKIPTLKPAFGKDGTITAASSSSISDGAAALVLTRRSIADKLGLNVVARIRGTGGHAHDLGWFATAPGPAMKRAMEKAQWSASDVDLFEVNEAFAVVAMIAMRELNVPHAKMNVNGGACALGHPIGASGARIIATLLSALKRRGGKRGVAGVCLGGGEATAIAVELI
ncbi:MAG: acetyl-CoA C-acyltransferase [Polyangiales bacterium]